MGTTQDALERAERENRRHRPITPREPAQGEVRPGRDVAAVAKFVADHGDIKNNVLALGADGFTKRLLLINTFEGGESADCALRFAASLTEDSDLEVLFVDLNPWTQSLGEVLSIDYTLGLLDLFSQGGEKAPRIDKVGPGDLYTARLGGDHARLAELLESGGFDRFLDSVSERFDFLILNLPGGAGFQESRVLCTKVDAAALILKSDASADQVALHAKKYIENPSEKLLGVIVDKAKSDRRKRVEVVGTVIATCLVFGLGFFVGDLRMEPGDAVPDRVESVARVEKGIDPPRPKRAIPFALLAEQAKAEAPIELGHEAPGAATGKSAESAVAGPVEEIRVKQARVEETLVTETRAEKAQATEDQTEVGQARTVVVSQGDNLFRIILGAYGTYNERLLRLVLDENPEIPSSKNIIVGRTIRLPRVD